MIDLFDSVLHLTKEINTLLKILEEGFRPSFAKETIEWKSGQPIKPRVAMVSFFNLDKSDYCHLVNRVARSTYGGYGIGLNRKWAMSNGLKPVNYLNQESDELGRIIEDAEKRHKNLEKMLGPITPENQEEQQQLDDFNAENAAYFKVISSYKNIKNTTGVNTHLGEIDYSHSSEDEWRFVVPEDNPELKGNPNLQPHYDEDENAKEKLDQPLDKIRLTFLETDIEFIVVPDEDSKMDVVKHLSNLRDRSQRSDFPNRILVIPRASI